MKDARLAQVWFAARPDQWDAVPSWVRQHEMDSCGYVIRSDSSRGLEPNWVKPVVYGYGWWE